MNRLVSVGNIENKIFQIRGKKVMLDKDLAALYDVETRVLNQAVRRNIDRFPEDFMFKLTEQEFLRCHFGTLGEDDEPLRSQFVISKKGGRRYLPYAFTQEGVAMLSSVLNSNRAIAVNIQIMRAFVSLRRIAVTYSSLKHKIEAMEKKYDAQFGTVFEAIKKLLEPPPEKPKRRIGFHAE